MFCVEGLVWMSTRRCSVLVGLVGRRVAVVVLVAVVSRGATALPPLLPPAMVVVVVVVVVVAVVVVAPLPPMCRVWSVAVCTLHHQPLAVPAVLLVVARVVAVVLGAVGVRMESVVGGAARWPASRPTPRTMCAPPPPARPGCRSIGWRRRTAWHCLERARRAADPLPTLRTTLRRALRLSLACLGGRRRPAQQL